MTQREIDEQLEWLARKDNSLPPIPNDNIDMLVSRMQVITLPEESPRHGPRSSQRYRPSSVSSLNLSNMTIDQPATDMQRIFEDMHRLEQEEEQAEISAVRSKGRDKRYRNRRGQNNERDRSKGVRSRRRSRRRRSRNRRSRRSRSRRSRSRRSRGGGW